MNPILRYALGIGGLLAALVGLYMIGHTDGMAKAERTAKVALVDSLRRAIDQAAEIAAQDAEILRADVTRQARVVTQFQIIDREINRYALTHWDALDCLDAGGMRLWRAAARGDAREITTAASDDVDPVPADAAGAPIGETFRPDYQLRGRGTFVSPAAGALSVAGGVGAGSDTNPDTNPDTTTTRPAWAW
jgi:hypothetical protein